ncbi:fimbria/pilus periplasmic chaperone [Pseudomonas aeruginosa]|uniref:fimbria/pilus periplasmic chaperone n=1 Tax=Pseudomonas aeruginosa TaxID=287 RepID=UPI00211ACF16|nr:fimbria/pilus periplasmic chaperone [Pseudomonas aeruginosa]
MKYPFSSRVIWGGILLLFSTLANAGITLGGTRVVLQAPAKEAAILVRNQASKDVMIQSWVEAGRRQKLSATPDLSGTVLPLCLIPNSALKSAPPFKSVVPKASACAGLPA